MKCLFQRWWGYFAPQKYQCTICLRLADHAGELCNPVEFNPDAT